MLQAINVTKTFPSQKDRNQRTEAVKNVNLSLKKGELCALVGESGSGKSTLSQLLIGLLAPTSGEVLLDGENVIRKGRKEIRQIYSKIQMVLQDSKSALDPHLTVYDSIAEPIRNLAPCTKKEESERIRVLMEEMELADNLLQRRPHELSGGQQKRVCIARALSIHPEIILFDEAVSGLDVIVRKNVLDLIKRIHRAHNSAYLFITHDIDVALYIADKIFVMKDGEIVEQVICENGLACFSHPYSKLLVQTTVSSISKRDNGCNVKQLLTDAEVSGSVNKQKG